MAEMHTTMIKASITAYSTAVGPSSLFKKVTMERARRKVMKNTSLTNETWESPNPPARMIELCMASARTEGFSDNRFDVNSTPERFAVQGVR
jgi:hypothetical protein